MSVVSMSGREIHGSSRQGASFHEMAKLFKQAGEFMISVGYAYESLANNLQVRDDHQECILDKLKEIRLATEGFIKVTSSQEIVS